jgi:hypothetical protein
MQHLEGSGTPVLYIGRTVYKGKYYFFQPCLIFPSSAIPLRILITIWCPFLFSPIHDAP